LGGNCARASASERHQARPRFGRNGGGEHEGGLRTWALNGNVDALDFSPVPEVAEDDPPPRLRQSDRVRIGITTRRDRGIVNQSTETGGGSERMLEVIIDTIDSDRLHAASCHILYE
jgi:hypothetical protein